MARRSKHQARRGGGSDGLPGWAWLVMGVVVTIAVVMVAPKYFKAGHDGFFRPRPNPDAQPAPAAVEEAVVEDTAPPRRRASRDDDAAEPAAPSSEEKPPEYDFYTLLPGREVPVSDAEIAATERAEEARRQRLEAEQLARSQQDAAAAVDAVADASPATAVEPLPAPVTEPAPAPEPRASAASPAPSPTPATARDDGTRYLLQAGAFEASGQAEELKARIAMLGLGARVESARIDGRTVFRVRMGPYGTAGDLAEAKRKLAEGGLPAMAIKVQ